MFAPDTVVEKGPYLSTRALVLLCLYYVCIYIYVYII